MNSHDCPHPTLERYRNVEGDVYECVQCGAIIRLKQGVRLDPGEVSPDYE